MEPHQPGLTFEPCCLWTERSPVWFQVTVHVRVVQKGNWLILYLSPSHKVFLKNDTFNFRDQDHTVIVEEMSRIGFFYWVAQGNIHSIRHGPIFSKLMSRTSINLLYTLFWGIHFFFLKHLCTIQWRWALLCDKENLLKSS